MTDADRRERQRLELQAALDAAKDADGDAGARNRLGQFATPTALARDIVAEGCRLVGPGRNIRFLDPAIGTGAFYAALRAVAPADRLERCEGFEVDPHYATPAAKLWADTPLALRVEDFTRAAPPATDAARADLIVCNPPYVRHHHLDPDRKRQLQAIVRERLDIRPSGLSGLYCYFLWLAHAWLAPGAISGWLIPSEWMDVNYGAAVKEYLLARVRLVRIHRFAPRDVQFGDALVSSAIVWFRHETPETDADGAVELTVGGSLAAPDQTARVARDDLRGARKWTRLLSPMRAPRAASPAVSRGSGASRGDDGGAALPATLPALPGTMGDVFAIKRGVATGANAFFVLSPTQVAEHALPRRFLRPILPGPRYLDADEVTAGAGGEPAVARRRYLVDIDLPPELIEADHPAVWAYLQRGVASGIAARWLARHRTPWYAQERRPPAPLLCTYMGRARGDSGPFRFILNQSQATAANVYLLLYPRPRLARAIAHDPALVRAVWTALRQLPPSALTREGRVYGGGLHKLEPRELGRLPLARLAAVAPSLASLVTDRDANAP